MRIETITQRGRGRKKRRADHACIVYLDPYVMDTLPVDHDELMDAINRLERQVGLTAKRGSEALDLSLDSLNDDVMVCDWCQGSGFISPEGDVSPYACTKCDARGFVARHCPRRGEPSLLPLTGPDAWCAVRLLDSSDPGRVTLGSEQQALSTEPCRSCRGRLIPGHVCLGCGQVPQGVAIVLKRLRSADEAARVASMAAVDDLAQSQTKLGERAKRVRLLTFAERKRA
jgi:hypothetical protein